MIHTTNNGFTDGLLPALHGLSPLVSYDFSYRWNEEDRVERVCPYIDFAFLSCSDLNDEETKKLCRKLHEKGCSVVTATRGSKGATVLMGSGFIASCRIMSLRWIPWEPETALPLLC